MSKIVARLLVVEDDQKTAALLKRGLTESGFDVDVAFDGDRGLELARSGLHDLVILDVMLPGRDGWSLLTEFRKAERVVPVVVLSAVSATKDRVRGLELGADDYLVKPFSFSELLARVRSVLRRGGARPADILKVADLEVDVTRHRAMRGGQRLDLTPREFQLLTLLMRRVGEVITRKTIAEEVWRMFFDPGTNMVNVHMHRLRAKVDDPFPERLIHTERGIGYVLERRAS